MKRILPLLFLFTAGFISAQGAVSIPDFTRFLDYTTTLKDVDQQTKAENWDLYEDPRYLLIDGTIASITTLVNSDTEYVVEVELVSGEWLSLAEVEMYRIFVQFSGKKFADRFPQGRKIPEGAATVNERILVIGHLSGVYESSSGGYLPIMAGDEFRILK